MTLTDHITADLRRRLSTNHDSVDLRLEALAQTYQVSTQPVRHALEQLAREGVLRRKRHHGFNAPSSAAPRRRAPRAAQPVSERPSQAVHRQLSELAANLSLGGEEAYLREETTAEKLGASRNQVRAALTRLHGEGMVDHVPNRGWRIRAFSQDDLADFLEVREALEVRALTLAWPRLEREVIERILAGNRGNEAHPDNSLHDYWIAQSGNRYIQQFFAQQAPFFRALFAWEDHDRAAARQSCEQHRAILHAILADDRERASAALVRHIHDNHPVLQHRRPKTTSP